MAFTGFGPETLTFLRDLSLNNNREWFNENRHRYESCVREPAEFFILSLGSLLSETYPSIIYDTKRNGSGSLMRVYRDIRFSRDKRPFKENVGIIFPLMLGRKVEVPMFYFHIELGQIFFYGGQHVFSPAVLERYRFAVADEKTGVALESILAGLGKEGLELMEDPAYKRVPRPYSADHPRAALLRQAALGVGLNFSQEDLGSPELVGLCRDVAIRVKPLIDWLVTMNGGAR